MRTVLAIPVLFLAAPLLQAETHWAFAPLTRPPATGVDGFIQSGLDGLKPSPPAPAEVLLRRMHFDLIGIPPGPEETARFTKAFEADADRAVVQAVDRLLASPHYGERWGRHWLDLARYADSSGFHDDLDRPNAWRYRDYVIRSFNRDKPYGQFVREQLAGDQIDPSSEDMVAATGFCRNGPSNDNNVKPALAEQYRLDQLDDMLSTTTAVFLGLHVGCARCHDHKTDPIPQKDYYRLLAVFNNTEPKDVPLERFTGGHAEPAPQKKKGRKPAVRAIADTGARPRPTFVLFRGNPESKREEVSPGVPEVLAHLPIEFPEPKDGDTHTGRRQVLADWIVSRENPLTWRVMANRVWQHYFGEGLVSTPSNFGANGEPPSHPGLLDWLACELRDHQSLKQLHKTILLSKTYRQSSDYRADAAKADPRNRRLWRMSKKRMEAEIVRDHILWTSGRINLETGGPGIKPHIEKDLLSTSVRNKWPEVKEEGPGHWRRSVYVYVKRQLLMPMLELLDQPTASVSCGKRNRSTTPTASLTLLNSRFVNEQAAAFARRVMAESPGEPAARALRLAWGGYTEDQLANANRFLEEQRELHSAEHPDRVETLALTDLAMVLFNSSVFMYVN